MRRFKQLCGLIIVITILASCKTTSLITTSNIPSDIANPDYIILFTRLEFHESMPGYVTRPQQAKAEKYLTEKFKGKSKLIDDVEINNDPYADKKIYRYVVKNRVTQRVVTTTKVNDVPKMRDTQYVSGFYILDRETGKEQGLGSATNALTVFKGVVNKFNDRF